MIEPLESRIAPAATLVSPTTAFYTDVDGDKVTVVFSKAILNSGNVANVLVTSALGLGDQLQTIDLTTALAGNPDGTNITITAVPQDLTPMNAIKSKSGDGFASVGRINATNHTLGAVKVPGDLGVIDAGNTAVNAVALQGLTVQSLGEFGTTTGAPADLRSDLAGTVKFITVKGSVRNAFVDITGSTGMMPNVVNSSLGALTIGGSFLGGSVPGAGAINVAGNIGPVKIGGSVIAGTGQSTAQIGSIHGSMGAVTIGGDVIGGSSGYSGNIFAETTMGAVSIGGDLRADKTTSSAPQSGFIRTNFGSIASVKIGGSIVGGASTDSGSVEAATVGGAGQLGAVTIGRDLLGGGGMNSGRISAAGDIGALTIGGSLTGGTAAYSGLVAAGGALGAVKIARDLEGSPQANTGWIHAEKNIASLTVGHSITGSGGDDSGNVSTNASLGAVKIGGDLIGAGGLRSGRVFAGENMGAVSIVGSMLGGAGDNSGQIGLAKFTSVIHKIGGVTIGGDVVGAGGQFSGSLTVEGTFISEFDSFGAVKVAGDWKGGSGYHAGSIHGATLTSMTLGGSLIGGSNTFAGGWQMIVPTITIGGDVIGGSVDYSGFINCSPKTLTIGGSLIRGTATDSGELNGSVSKVTIGHDVRGPINLSSFGTLTIGGSILPGGSMYGTLGAITVKGSIVGTAAQNVQIIGRGDISLATGLKPYIPLASLTVGGRVEHALIAVGYQGGNWIDPDAQIGAVKVGGDWIASSLLAGVTPRDGKVGDGGDLKADAAMRDHPDLHSKIASIVIGGQVLGEVGDLSKTFGFGAEEIGSFKVNGVALPLKPGRNNDIAVGGGVVGAMVPVGSSRAFPGTVNDGFAVHVFEI